MKIKVARLRDTLDVLRPAVPRNPTLKVLSNVMVKDGKMSTTNLESFVTVTVPEADESFLFPFDEVDKMLKHVPGYEFLEMHAKRGKLLLAWPEGEATYPAGKTGDFPDVPEIEVKSEGDIDGDTFIPALSSALPYVARDEARPVLSGVTVQFGSPIEVAGGDGTRMAHIVLPLLFPGEHAAIIPAGAVSTLVHVMEKSPRHPPLGEALVPILLAKRLIHVALDGKKGLKIDFSSTISVMVKLVDGKPPEWLKVIPKDEPVLTANFFASEFDTAVRRVADVAQKGKNVVRFEFTDHGVLISARADGREISAKVSCFDLQGAPNRFALNLRYLTSYLKDKDSVVAISWVGGKAPVAFQHAKHPKVLIMPMEAEWDKELSTEPPAPASEPAAQEEQMPEKPAVDESIAVNAKPTRQRSKKKT